MADENFAGYLSALTSKTDAIARDVKAARDDIQATQTKVANIQRMQTQAMQQVNQVADQVKTLAAGQEALKADLFAKLSSLQEQVRSYDTQLDDVRRMLSDLVARNREENAQHALESEKGLFLLRVRELGHQVGDGAVRWVIVMRALKVCAEREIVPEKFQSPADQTAIDQGLTDLRELESGCSDDDRREGALFETIAALSAELAETTRQTATHAQQITETRELLLAKKGALADAIAILEKPEAKTDYLARRYLRRWGTAGSVFFMLCAASTAIANAAAYAPTLDAVVPAYAVLAVFCLVFAWWNSDARRVGRLERLKHQSSDNEQSILQSERSTATDAAAEQNVVADYRKRLEQVGGDVSETATLTALSAAASNRLATWLSAHSDVRYLAANWPRG
ncbi:hypothetical protein [Mesorhizobium carmichaelinearum]|uniref:hypothetical protein n=1 Tax=Mesorhizobium carmichaelinearum TaxID=1208188 RepID=UPI000BA2D01F|nr:hypothetical protein [Mesorhizobium carmichaelinearum]